VTSEFFRALSHQDFGTVAAQSPQLLAGTFFQWITWHQDDSSGQPAPPAEDPMELTVERVSAKDFGEGLTAMPPGMVDVEVSCFDTAAGIYASGTYRADRFTQCIMDRFIADLRSAAERFVRNPDARVAVACDEN